MIDEKLTETLRSILRGAKCAVFFGGAGVSTDSGIPDFRGTNGLYEKPAEDGEAPEYLLSASCLRREPEKFFRYYREHMIYPDAKPNAAHIALAKLEEAGLIKAVITQNIDGLHRAAGSKRVYEVHGTTARNYCNKCRRPYKAEAVTESSEDVPKCACGGVIRPDVVLYEEGLDGFVFSDAAELIGQADVLIVGGTSLTVYPAASLVPLFKGEHLIIVNYTETPYDHLAEFVIRDSVSTVLPALV